MECLLGFASSVSRDLVCGALNQLRYLCCFKNFVKRLEEEESSLIITRDSVQKFVKHVKKQARNPDAIVDKWLEDAINDVHNVNQLLEEARTPKHCCFGHCPNWIWRYHVGKKLANKTMDLKKFIDEGRKYVPFDRIATLPSNTLDMLLEKCMNFESRQSAYEQLLDAVKNNDVSMIGLYGMGGCGKTTLAMEVRKFVEAEHLFEEVLFVPVSSTAEVRRVQEKIASSLQFEFPEPEEMQRAQRLCSRLTQEKNIFIILDDVWEKLDLGHIGIPSSEHHKGCKILITSRSEAVCTLMDCQRKIYLPILTDEEAWTLFQNKALISEATSDTLKEMGRLISNECKGLPVTIAAVACSLKGKTEMVWSVTLNKLRHSKPINIERGLTDPYKCLRLSYDNLDAKEAKSLFLLCSVFPEDCEILVELLTRCAIGLGVVGEVHSYEEARSEVIAAKIKLVSCCLLLDEDHERVKMHDLVRDVAHLIAKNENKMIKCEVEKDVMVEQNSVRYLYCVKFPNDLDCSNLEFLRLRTKMKEFDGIFKRMGMLKVLILDNGGDGKTPLSTICFKTLTNLRDLIIFNYELSDFSFLSGMKNLQSLSLFGCLLPSFPELQTDVAITLKLLELTGCDIKVKNFEVIKRIPFLEELYIIDIQGEWDANSEDNIKEWWNAETNIEFFKTFSVPQTLQSYGIVLGSYDFEHFNYGDIYTHRRTLLLNHFDVSNEVMKGLAKKAKDLFVRNIHGGAKSMIPDIFQIEGGYLNELNKLEVRFSQELECLIDTRSHSSEVVTLFSKLHTLIIDNMENLRVIWHCFLPANGPFENLENLSLSYCPGLTSLFTYGVARSLVKLKILKISRCDGLKHILTDEEKAEKSQDEFTSGRHPVQIFQNLQEVEVFRCREVKHIFPANIVGGLTQLKVLEIEECEKLEEIIGDIVPLTEQDRKELDEIVEEGTLSSLASLRIKGCGKLGSIFTTSIAKTLTSLEELFIESCKSLKDIVTHESIVEDEHDCESDISIFQSLKKLHISYCALLVGIFPVSFVGELNEIDTDDEYGKENMRAIFPNLKELSVYNCSQLKYMIDQYDVANKDYKEIRIQFSALEILSLQYVPKFVSICSINTLTVTWPSLKDFHCYSCLTIITSTKDPKGIQNHLPTLQTLNIKHSAVERIFCLNEHEMIGQPVSLRLENMELYNVPQLTYIWVGPNNSLTLQHLTTLYISYCGKLEVIFPKSIVRCLPQLKWLTITECMELKQIMEEDESILLSFGCDKEASKNYFAFPNLEKLEIIECAKLEVVFPKSVLRCLPKLKLLKIRKCKELRQIIEGDKNLSNLVSPQPCFPKLEALLVDHCPKLKRCVSESASHDLPNLHLLAINGAYELEELVGCKEGKIKVELPRLKLLIFMHLSNFSQEIELHNLKNCIVYKCPKLSLTSTTTLQKLWLHFPYKDFINTEVRSWEFEDIVRSIDDYSTINGSSEFASSQVRINQSMNMNINKIKKSR
ncbi:probable disease resistance protein At1g12280 [Vigna radiata var. radiata]|uniref:Probable disease resistance protein At1g12280 n=1 Tax=Vigna radiata var. radiata TaxID=3916 RepID=A0A3Q0ESY0_VIGRR|nr:probable disease resistance protein At1g12280 [Vigna radiata var. radiata]